MRQPLLSGGSSQFGSPRRRCGCRGEGCRRTLALVLCAAALSVWGAAERVSFKVMLDSMVRYRYVLAQVVCLCYVPIMFGACYLRRCCLPRAMDDDAWLDMTEFSKWKFSYMAFLDALQGLAVMVLGGVVPGPLTVLLLQATIPFVAAVVASISRCRIKYSWQHIAGSLAILAGIAVNVFPLFLPGPRGGERPGGNGSNGCAFTSGDRILDGTSYSNSTFTLTLGSENATNATGNNVLVRIKLESGDSITALSIE